MKLPRRRYLEETYLGVATRNDRGNYKVEYLHFLTAIYLDSKKHIQVALELTEVVLKRLPNNFNALWNRANICLFVKQQDIDELVKLHESLLNAAEMKFEMFKAEIEIAEIYFEFLEGDFKYQSIADYERVLRQICQFQMKKN